LPESDIDLAAQQREIDWLGQEAHRATLDRLASRFRIALSGDHDDGNIGPLRAHHGLP
jgi:hypothetical protein